LKSQGPLLRGFNRAYIIFHKAAEIPY